MRVFPWCTHQFPEHRSLFFLSSLFFSSATASRSGSFLSSNAPLRTDTQRRSLCADPTDKVITREFWHHGYTRAFSTKCKRVPSWTVSSATGLSLIRQIFVHLSSQLQIDDKCCPAVYDGFVVVQVIFDPWKQVLTVLVHQIGWCCEMWIFNLKKNDRILWDFRFWVKFKKVVLKLLFWRWIRCCWLDN